MVKKVVIVQSCYIPWKGYFDLIDKADELILYDDVQFTRRDWRNRNIIKTVNGSQWLTIPVDIKGRYFQKINETRISNPKWVKTHWKTILYNYIKTPYFKQYSDYFASLYAQCEHEIFLSQINFILLQGICQCLNIATQFSWSSDYVIDDELKKTERLLALCQKAGATHYISGPSAKNYIQNDLFEKAGVNLSYIDYSHYPEYPQLFGDFIHGVTILDLIFNTGPNAANFFRIE